MIDGDELVEIDFKAVFDNIIKEHALEHGIEQTIVHVSDYVRVRLTTLLATHHDALKHNKYT